MDKKTTKTITVKRVVPKQAPKVHDSKRRTANKSGGGSLDPGPSKKK